MKKIKLDKDEKNIEIVPSTIEYFYKYSPLNKDGSLKETSTPMVRIKGNFFKGGFNLSKSKVKAVLDNIELLQKFANGDLDKVINELEADEVLQP